MAEPLTPPVLVVDLDGTLVDVNTFPLFTKFVAGTLLRRRRFGAAARLGLAIARRKVARGRHRDLKQAVCVGAEQMDETEIARWTTALSDRHSRPSVVSLIEGWEGSTILCTAAPAPCAAPLGDRFGFDLVLASHLTPAGLRDNVGVAKVEGLKDIGAETVELAVSDDIDEDLPLLRFADEALVVEPTGVLRSLGEAGS